MKSAMKTVRKLADGASQVSFVSSLDTSLNYISSGEDSPPSSPKSSSKRSRNSQEDLLAFNYKINAHYNLLCAEAYCDHSETNGTADLPLLQEIMKFVGQRIFILESSAPNLPPSTPRKTKKVRKIIHREVSRALDGEKNRVGSPTLKRANNSGTDEISRCNLNKPKLSLYRADPPPFDQDSATNLDLLLQQEDLAVSESPKTPSRRPACPLKLTQPGSSVSPSTSQTSKVASPRIFVISDDEAEVEVSRGETARYNLFKRLIAYRRKVSTTRARLPEEILSLQTIRKLSEQPPADYKELGKILAETSNIPEHNIEERKAYIEAKLKEYGAELIPLCSGYPLKVKDGRM